MRLKMVKNIIRIYTDALLIDSSLYENMGSILSYKLD